MDELKAQVEQVWKENRNAALVYFAVGAFLGLLIGLPL